jgi:hypothetical protein
MLSRKILKVSTKYSICQGTRGFILPQRRAQTRDFRLKEQRPLKLARIFTYQYIVLSSSPLLVQYYCRHLMSRIELSPVVQARLDSTRLLLLPEIWKQECQFYQVSNVQSFTYVYVNKVQELWTRL